MQRALGTLPSLGPVYGPCVGGAGVVEGDGRTECQSVDRPSPPTLRSGTSRDGPNSSYRHRSGRGRSGLELRVWILFSLSWDTRKSS